MATSDEPERMGNLLIEEGLITQEEIDEASKSEAVAASGLASLLKNAVCVRRSELAAFVGTDYQILEIPDLTQIQVAADAFAALSARLAEENQAVPLAKTGGILFAAAANPSPEVARALRQATGMRIKLLQAPAEAVQAILQSRYRGAPAVPAPKDSGVPPSPAPAGEKVPAVRVTAEEKAAVELYLRLVTEWETTYTEARAVQAIKVA